MLVLAASVLVAGGGGGGFWWWRTARLQGQAVAGPAEPQGAAMVPLDPFLVNLADKDASRFLRTTVRLVVDEEHDVASLEKDPVRLARVRSEIIDVLSTQLSDALVTPEGKSALKRAIAARSTAALRLEVRDVLFTDFVVQF